MSAAPTQIQNVTTIEVAIGKASDPVSWDAYVRAHAGGSFFHLSSWGEVVQSTYGYDALYLTARRDGRTVGVLPLVDVKAPLLGRSLISTPFTVGGGPLADDETALKVLLSEAVSIGEGAGVKYIECRTDFSTTDDWLAKTGIYAGFKMALPVSESEHLNAIPRKRRAEVRKTIAAERSGDLLIRYDGDADEFYGLYAQSLRQLGTPVFPKRFLQGLMGAFREDIEIAIVEYHGVSVAALLSFCFRDVVLPYYVGASPAARRARAYDFAYWSAMRRAVAGGRLGFDFGRSRIGSGSYAYKKLWGCAPMPLTYHVRLINAAKMANINPSNPKFALFAKLWPCLPLAATNALGPLLARNLP